MRMTLILKVLAVLLTGTSMAGAADMAGRLASITKVISTSEVATVSAQGVNNLAGRQMSKFLDQLVRVQEKLQVAWTAPEKSWSGLSEVRLDYRAAGSSDTHALVQRYESTRAGRHLSTFTIPVGSTLEAWRVSLRQQEKIIDQKSSGNWK